MTKLLEKVTTEKQGLKAIAEAAGMSVSKAQKEIADLMKAGNVLMEGEGAEATYYLKPGETAPTTGTTTPTAPAKAKNKNGKYTVHLDENAQGVMCSVDVGGQQIAILPARESTTQKACRKIKALLGLKGQSDEQKEFDADWRTALYAMPNRKKGNAPAAPAPTA